MSEDLHGALETSVWVIFIAAFLFPSFVEFEKTGNNIFQVYVNGSEVGVVSSVEEIDPLLMQARARVARNYEDIILIDTQVSYQGSEVIYGKVDSEDTVISRMANVLRKDTRVVTAWASPNPDINAINEWVYDMGNPEFVAFFTNRVVKAMQAGLDGLMIDNSGIKDYLWKVKIWKTGEKVVPINQHTNVIALVSKS